MIDRLVKEENSPTLDTLDQIAKACGLETWQLLSIDFDPAPLEHTPAPKLVLSDKQRELLELIHGLLNK
jgi:transcriptional regulator with XRE-family HTH domain